MIDVKLTNGEETFLLGQVIEDEAGPVHGIDSRGNGYTRCDTANCDHNQAIPGYAVWHDDERTETLWAYERTY